MEHPQPLLFHPELDDSVIRGGWGWPIVEELLGGPELCRCVQFEFRQTPPGAEDVQMGFHRDQGATLMHRERGGDVDSPSPIDYIAAITLLTPSNRHTPNTMLVPRSSRYAAIADMRSPDVHAARTPSIEQLRAEMGPAYQEVAVQQPAGIAMGGGVI
jgi:hypothetical protein